MLFCQEMIESIIDVLDFSIISLSVLFCQETIESIIDVLDFSITSLSVLFCQETIETACRDNDMPSLQAQLLSLGHDVTAQWAEVVKIGLLRAWSHVQHKDISAAQTIISNLVSGV